MSNIFTFYNKNIIRLKELALDCPECSTFNSDLCGHLTYLKRYIKELEASTPLDEQKFDAFYKEYPRKVGKKYAEKMWQRLKVDDTLFETIMKALKSHKKSLQWLKDNGQFIPNPSTWLNQERWNDEVIEPEKKPTFFGIPMKKDERGKWWVMKDGKPHEFTGDEKDIRYI